MDERFEKVENMGALKVYEVPAGRRGDVTATIQLDDAAVARYRARGITPRPVGEPSENASPTAKAATARNKARKPANKSATARKPRKPRETTAKPEPAGEDNPAPDAA